MEGQTDVYTVDPFPYLKFEIPGSSTLRCVRLVAANGWTVATRDKQTYRRTEHELT